MLTLHFTLAEDPVIGPQAVGAGGVDPGFFIDFKFTEEKDSRGDMVGATAPALKISRTRMTARPTPRKLGERNFMGGDNANYGAMFANKIHVECP